MRKTCLIIILLFIAALNGFAQSYVLYGKITNNKLEPLAFASVQLKQAPGGTVSKEDGSYALKVERGTYDMMVSMVGYKPQTIRVTITSNYIQNLILEEDEAGTEMEEFVVRVKIKDRSEEYIKNVIRHKEAIMNASGAYSSKIYIKAVQQDSSTKKKQRGIADSAVLDDHEDLNNMAMAEISLKLDYESDSRMKEERLGVKKRGEADNLFYLTTTTGDFNFYNNLIKVPSISATPFLSPISYSGLLAYKFKSIKIEKRNGVRVFVISVKPRQISNATVEGEITIQDSSWAILHTKFRFPSYHLTEYDFFEVEQEYDYVKNTAWMMTRQQFNYYSKSSKRKLSGQTLITYNDFELQKQFGKKTFGVEISSTAQEAYEKDSSFWETVRTEPLTEKEIRFIRYRDSIYRVTNTEAYLDSIELVNNKPTWKKVILFGQTINNRKKEREWVIPPLISLYEPFQFGGGRLRLSSQYFKRFASRKDIKVYTELSYGFRNKDINGTITLNRMYNPFNRGYYMFDLTRAFDLIYAGDALLNQVKKSSYFLNNYLAAGHGLEVLNGLSVYTEFALALRRDVNGYKTSKKMEELFPDVLDLDDQPVKFDPFNAVYSQLLIKYTPAQRYIREPKEKIILGSKWPTFYARYRKGIPGPINSVVDFDYLEFGIEQKIPLGLLGVMRYHAKTGSFLSQKDLRLLDYSYQRRGDPWLFMNPDEAFQALDSTFPLFDRFYQMHLVHEFNGAILNKIPLFKKLQLREVVGGGFLIAPEMNDLRYAEFFGGIERVFKWPFNPMTKFKLGFYVVGSVANQLNSPVQFKFGFTTWDRKRNKWH
jgi:hypothetical protein